MVVAGCLVAFTTRTAALIRGDTRFPVSTRYKCKRVTSNSRAAAQIPAKRLVLMLPCGVSVTMIMSADYYRTVIMSTPNGNLFFTRLRELRGSKTKAAFAKELGIPAPVYQRYEDGRMPTVENLSVISRVTGRSLDWLLGREELMASLKRDEPPASTEKPDERLETIAMHWRAMGVQTDPDEIDGQADSIHGIVNRQAERLKKNLNK